jgi:toxin HigB-1
MIRSFKSRETEKVFLRIFSLKYPQDIQGRAFMKLNALNSAVSLEDLRLPPSNHLENLKGTREGQWSIRINDQWRVCFVWHEGNAEQVEIIDYH